MEITNFIYHKGHEGTQRGIYDLRLKIEIRIRNSGDRSQKTGDGFMIADLRLTIGNPRVGLQLPLFKLLHRQEWQYGENSLSHFREGNSVGILRLVLAARFAVASGSG